MMDFSSRQLRAFLLVALLFLGVCRIGEEALAGFLAEPTRFDHFTEQRRLDDAVEDARQPFLDFHLSRVNANGSRQVYKVSGEPMFNQSCRFLGYRGIGVETSAKN